MTNTIVPHASRRFVIPTDVVMSASYETVYVVTSPGTTAPAVVLDQNVSRQTDATVRNDAQIVATVNKGYGGITFESSNPSIATVDQNGYVTVVGTGSVTIRVKSQFIIRNVLQFVATAPSPNYYDTWVSYVTGSLGKAISDAVDARIAASSQKNVFTTVNHGTSTYVRNTNCWINQDKTSWPVWNSWTNNQFYCGCAVTPKHMLVASHAEPPNGTSFRFVTNSNTVVTRTKIAQNYVGSADVCIIELDSALPGTITPVKVLPTDYTNKITIGNVPLICGNQDSELIIRDWYRGTFNIFHKASTITNRLPYTEPVIAGDSGAPVYTIINNELVAVGTHWATDSASNPHSVVAAINTAISGSGYSLTTADLSSFPSY